MTEQDEKTFLHSKSCDKAEVVKGYGKYNGDDDIITRNYKHGKKKLILIRHGMSTANEFMDRPGNRWGDPTFTDDATFIDAPLSSKGIEQAKELRERFKDVILQLEDRRKHSTIENAEDDTDNDHDNILVVTSPLTRCIQTMNIGVIPNIIQSSSIGSIGTYNNRKNTKKILVQPLATERVYTASDTGRPISVLQSENPHLDFDTCFQRNTNNDNMTKKHPWWYSDDTTNNEKNSKHHQYEEWRPYGEGQFYAVPGEPVHVFNRRMVRLFDWIKSRKEENIILVCHWAVIRWFTGEDVQNCHVKEILLDEVVLKDEMLIHSKI